MPEVSKITTTKSKIYFRELFTKGVTDPFETVAWVKRDAVLIGRNGVEVFRQNDVLVPKDWSDRTVNIVAEKYFRVVNGVKENSAKQMFNRVASWIAFNGVKQDLVEGTAVKNPDGTYVFTGSAQILYKELLYMLLHGMHAFNSPVWFNVGVVENPQCSACFIQSVDDTMESIVDLQKREVMLFKQGSGTGSNLSALRSSYEKLSGGGKASGPVSFMKMFDSGAGVTKSGGTTRRAAKMVVLNIDHPDILQQANGEDGFITCKSHSENLARDLHSTGKYTAEWNKPGNVYDLVPYQNANNSVRVTDEFMNAVMENKDWYTKAVKTREVIHTYKARDIWNAVAEAAHISGDPGIQFDTETNDWHTCPNSGRINASNPCSEYLFLDDTACNLSSLNLMKFMAEDGKTFEVEKFIHACEIATASKEIIVDASSYPSEKLKERSRVFRTLGLGFTNLGALLTYVGLPYDSNEGRNLTASITAIMTGSAYRMSAEMARVKGPFEAYEINKVPMLRVITKHWNAAKKLPSSSVKEYQMLVDKAYDVWRDAFEVGTMWGFRNAQVSVIAPTGTISFLMDCDTTGIEPMLGCVTYKKLVGEGTIIIINRIVEAALNNLGYPSEAIKAIQAHLESGGNIQDAPGFDDEAHGPIFAQALGPYALSPEAHIDMMIAVQPFISGGISKTVNMPNEATPRDIAEIYERAWKGKLKCVAVFRDGCKLSQPISTKMTDSSNTKKSMNWSDRKRLPKTRASVTHKFQIGPQEGYLTAGLYPDGTLGEIFIEVGKQGSSLMGFVDAWAQSISIGIQHGVPFEVMREKFQDMTFEPYGFTGEDGIPRAKSIPDYVFRWLEKNIINKTSETPIDNIDTYHSSIREHTPQIQQVSSSLDGPPCTSCGNMTRRSGSCYTCTSCGTNTGCS